MMIVSGLGRIKADKKENHCPHGNTADALKSEKTAEKYTSSSAALGKPLKRETYMLSPPTTNCNQSP
ncbi:hypothetical protein SUGI_0338740 [Cryptomeria japonica]|nr:hypothetical protein SUGI_0338740 [Cryptomeria japonica]